MVDLRDWITAVGTGGAFALAALIYANDRRSTRKEVREKQARLVDAWVTNVRWEEGENSRLCVVVAFSNDSAESARAAGVSIAFDDIAPGQLFSVGVLPPTMRGSPLRKECWLHPPANIHPDWQRQHIIGIIRLKLSFIDTAGVWWDRGPRQEFSFRKNPSKVRKAVKKAIRRAA